MYSPPDATWEIVKNGIDAIFRLLAVRPDHQNRSVRVELVRNSPLCRDDVAMLITDSGTGLTEPDLQRYLCIGNEEESGPNALMDQKRLGRIAAFALMKREARQGGYWVMSSTSGTGAVMLMNVTPKGLAEQKLEARDIPRDDYHLGGRCPEGSFTAILIPHVIPSMRDPNKIRAALQWNIPRYSTEGSIQILVGDEVMVPPDLPNELVIHWKAADGTVEILSGPSAAAVNTPADLDHALGDIIGFFAKTENIDRRGVRFCDDVTRTRVAQALSMIAKVPFPFGKSELEGDLFLPGDVIRQQNTDRTGFSPEYLESEEWKRIMQILIAHFVKPLSRLISDDVLLRDDPLFRAMKQAVDAFKDVFGPPDKATRIPTGIQPPPDFGGDEEGDEVPGPGPGPGPGPRPKPHPRSKNRKAQPQLLKYKDRTYVLSTSSEGPHVMALFCDTNTVCLNTRDFMTQEGLKNSPAALRLSVLLAIIRCIEEQLNELNPVATNQAVHESMLKFYSRSTP